MGSLKERKVSKIQSTYIEQREQNQQRQTKKKRGLMRRLAVFGLFVCVLSGIAISTLYSQSQAIEEKEAERHKVQTELASLVSKQKSLEEEIVKLNDDEYIAKIARRDLFLTNEGEVIFNLPNKEEDKD